MSNKELKIEEVVERAARAVRSNFREFVEYEDLVSEGWTYVLSHEKEMLEYQDIDPPLAAWRLHRNLYRKMSKYARKERAHKLGYEPDDEAFYGQAILAKLLPHVLSGDRAQPVTEQEEVRVKADLAHGNNWAAMYLDVLVALRETDLTGNERVAINLTFGEGFSQEALAAFLDCDPRTAGKTLIRALTKITDTLGGLPPGECPYDCECHDSAA